MYTANVQDGARLDIAMNGLWGGRSECVFVDVRIFNPLAQSNAANSLSACYKKHVTSKRELMDNGFEKLNVLPLLL